MEASQEVAPEPKVRSAWRSPVRLTTFLVVVLLILLLGASAVFSIGLYRLGWQGPFIDRVISVVPFPVALANRTIIRFDDYEEDVRTLNYYFDNNSEVNAQQQKPKADEIAATVLNRLIYDSVVAELTSRYDIAVSDSELEEQIQTIADSSGSRENVSSLLRSLYGWDENQFKDKVLRPYVALEKLGKALSENGTLNGDSENRAQAVLAKVKEGKTSFGDLAKESSEDTTAAVGGDLGFFGKDEMDADFMTAIESLEVGQTTSELVKTQFGYHIIKLLEKIDDPEKGTQYHASHILFRTKTIDDYVNEQIAQRNIRLFVPGFRWDAENLWVIPTTQTQG